MKKYKVWWMEKHYKEVEALNDDEAFMIATEDSKPSCLNHNVEQIEEIKSEDKDS